VARRHCNTSCLPRAMGNKNQTYLIEAISCAQESMNSFLSLKTSACLQCECALEWLPRVLWALWKNTLTLQWRRQDFEDFPQKWGCSLAYTDLYSPDDAHAVHLMISSKYIYVHRVSIACPFHIATMWHFLTVLYVTYTKGDSSGVYMYIEYPCVHVVALYSFCHFIERHISAERRNFWPADLLT
jgi:hypothetical protein